MKKRIVAALMCGAICLSLAACEPEESSASSGSNIPSSTPQESQTPSDSEATNAIPGPSADLGDYHVEIKSATLAEDYEGSPTIVVTYSWTNNSDDTTSAMVAVSCTAFQDGVELESAIIADDSVYDSNSLMKEVRPGTTIDVQSAFVLSSTTSTVEVEIGEWISFQDNPPIAYMEFDPSAL